MTLLLDTNVLVWLAEGVRLGPQARAAILAGDVHVSSISVWEIAIKTALGRLDVPDAGPLLETPGLRELAFTSAHARAAGELPPHHRDPFDRALVAQARTESLVLVTADRLLQRYDVALLDAAR